MEAAKSFYEVRAWRHFSTRALQVKYVSQQIRPDNGHDKHIGITFKGYKPCAIGKRRNGYVDMMIPTSETRCCNNSNALGEVNPSSFVASNGRWVPEPLTCPCPMYGPCLTRRAGVMASPAIGVERARTPPPPPPPAAASCRRCRQRIMTCRPAARD